MPPTISSEVPQSSVWSLEDELKKKMWSCESRKHFEELLPLFAESGGFDDHE